MIVNLKKSGSKFNLPTHQGDAGYDLVAYSEPKIIGKRNEINPNLWEEIQYIEYDTNVFIEPLEREIWTSRSDDGAISEFFIHHTDNIYYSLLYPRSSLSKYNLILANHVGVIDSGYQDSIKLRFKYFAQPKDMIIFMDQVWFKIDESKIYQKGDKIGQLIFAKHIHPEEIKEVDEFIKSERDLGGFGSTGK